MGGWVGKVTYLFLVLGVVVLCEEEGAAGVGGWVEAIEGAGSAGGGPRRRRRRGG